MPGGRDRPGGAVVGRDAIGGGAQQSPWIRSLPVSWYQSFHAVSSEHDGETIISYFSNYETGSANSHTPLSVRQLCASYALFIRNKERLRENLHDLRGCLDGGITRARAGILEEDFIAAILQHILLHKYLIIKQFV